MLPASWMRRIRLGWLAGRELGPAQVAWYGLYRIGLWSGHFRRVLADPLPSDRAGEVTTPAPLWSIPDPHLLAAWLKDEPGSWLAEVEEIVGGQVRLFGGPPVPLAWASAEPLKHWTAYEGGGSAATDIKFLWEPARFGWVYTLGRAYQLTADERCPQAFWSQAEAFLEANLPYRGPHWASAQEVALRLIAFTFAGQVFAPSTHATSVRQARLAQSIAQHAARIPPTLSYARAQNNNHLLSEAAGLYTAGLALPDHPQAAAWRETGWKVFNQGLQAQIAPDGTYAQHSTNYHRLMLQLALWVDHLARSNGEPWPAASRERLAAATHWLLALQDRVSGRVPNLGPHDGAYIFPFTALPFSDYRPVLQAAGRAFLGEAPFTPGIWDEMGSWLGVPPASVDRHASSRVVQAGKTHPSNQAAPHTLCSPDGQSWAYLRAAHFTGRPGHADQLHLDLWWRGLNVAQDAGTYLYNAPPPWDNALRKAEVHNTVTVAGQDQMLSAGRFLYLERAQARVTRRESIQTASGAGEMLVAEQDGYRRLGVRHTRSVTVVAADWEVVDTLHRPGAESQPGQTPLAATLHWLLPDWPFEILSTGEDWAYCLRLDSPLGPIRLQVKTDQAGSGPASEQFQIIRAGELRYGSGPVSPTWGWSSPTYGVKIPALAIRLTQTCPGLIRFTTNWTFPVRD